MLATQGTPELLLERLEPRHAPELFALTVANRDYLREWLPWLDRVTSVEDTVAFIEVARRQQRDRTGLQTAIRVHGSLVGVVGLHKIDWGSHTAGIGYWLAADAQGRGIMTRACALHLDHAFDNLALRRVEIRCAAANARSRAVPERLGFRARSVVRDAEWLYDHYVDHVVYALRAEEWARNVPRPAPPRGGLDHGQPGESG